MGKIWFLAHCCQEPLRKLLFWSHCVRTGLALIASVHDVYFHGVGTSYGYLLPPGMCILWSSSTQKNDFTYAATQSVAVPLSVRHVAVFSLWRLRLISGHFTRTLDGKVALGQVFLHVLHVSPPSIFPSALQTRILFIFHLCYVILPTDTMPATGTEHCMLSDITNMICKRL